VIDDDRDDGCEEDGSISLCVVVLKSIGDSYVTTKAFMMNISFLLFLLIGAAAASKATLVSATSSQDAKCCHCAAVRRCIA